MAFTELWPAEFLPEVLLVAVAAAWAAADMVVAALADQVVAELLVTLQESGAQLADLLVVEFIYLVAVCQEWAAVWVILVDILVWAAAQDFQELLAADLVADSLEWVAAWAADFLAAEEWVIPVASQEWAAA